MCRCPPPHSCDILWLRPLSCRKEWTRTGLARTNPSLCPVWWRRIPLLGALGALGSVFSFFDLPRFHESVFPSDGFRGNERAWLGADSPRDPTTAPVEGSRVGRADTSVYLRGPPSLSSCSSWDSSLPPSRRRLETFGLERGVNRAIRSHLATLSARLARA